MESEIIEIWLNGALCNDQPPDAKFHPDDLGALADFLKSYDGADSDGCFAYIKFRLTDLRYPEPRHSNLIGAKMKAPRPVSREWLAHVIDRLRSIIIAP